MDSRNSLEFISWAKCQASFCEGFVRVCNKDMGDRDTGKWLGGDNCGSFASRKLPCVFRVVNERHATRNGLGERAGT